MPLSATDLPGIFCALQVLEHTLTAARAQWPELSGAQSGDVTDRAERQRIFEHHANLREAIGAAGDDLRRRLSPDDPDWRGSLNGELLQTTLPIDIVGSLLAIWTKLTRPQWEQFAAGQGADHIALAALLADAEQAISAQDGRRWAKLPPKSRKLVVALDGKGDVPLAEAFRSVYGRETLTASGRKRLWKLALRTDLLLSEFHYGHTILRYSGVLTLKQIRPAT
jgi:hypothetical protein